jgi:hypothetical protein
MPLDTLEADLAVIVGVDGVAPRWVDTDSRRFELIMKALPRDDPLRRSYLQRRWRGISTPLSRDMAYLEFERALLSQIAPGRG